MSNVLSLRQIGFAFPVILLAACAQSPQGMSPTVQAPAAVSPTATQKPADVTSPVPQQPAAPAQVKISEPARLKGLTPLQVREVLGQPGFQRRDAPAEIWQYRARGCILDLFIYDLGNGQTVDHWSVRSPARVGDADCFQQLVDQGRPSSGS